MLQSDYPFHLLGFGLELLRFRLANLPPQWIKFLMSKISIENLLSRYHFRSHRFMQQNTQRQWVRSKHIQAPRHYSICLNENQTHLCSFDQDNWSPVCQSICCARGWRLGVHGWLGVYWLLRGSWVRAQGSRLIGIGDALLQPKAFGPDNHWFTHWKGSRIDRRVVWVPVGLFFVPQYV